MTSTHVTSASVTSEDSPVLAVTGATFDEEVTGASVPVIVDFWAEWCPPCHALAPTLAGIAADHAESLRVLSIDVDAHPEIAQRYGVLSLPTLLVFDGGVPVKRLVGARGRQHLLAELSDLITV